jgi:hypothetical protein
LGGAIGAVAALAYYLFRQWMGLPTAPGDVIVRVFLTFVIGYAATGILVWYVLHIAWRELAKHEDKPKTEGEMSEEEHE